MNYLIKFKVFDKKGNKIRLGTIRVKNNTSELEAKCRLDDYLRKKVKGFDRLEIDSCEEDINGFELFNDIFK